MQKIPQDISVVLKDLFEALPPERAMATLVVAPDAKHHSDHQAHVQLVEKIIKNPVISANLALVSALWLYVDELDRSHVISQNITSATGSYWHGIMHRREGDFSNSHYWFRKVGKHPAIVLVGGKYDPHQFIDDAEHAHQSGKNPAELIDLQRREWENLFAWCANGNG